MKAETVYNVIQALSPEEMPKLYEMLGLIKKIEKKPIDAEEKQNLIMATRLRIRTQHFGKKRIP